MRTKDEITKRVERKTWQGTFEVVRGGMIKRDPQIWYPFFDGDLKDVLFINSLKHGQVVKARFEWEEK